MSLGAVGASDFRAFATLFGERNGFCHASDSSREFGAPWRRFALDDGVSGSSDRRAAAHCISDLRSGRRRCDEKSLASLEAHGKLFRFEKKASTISYGAHADDILTTVRRTPNADSGDQVLVLTHFARDGARADERMGHARYAWNLQPGVCHSCQMPRRSSAPSSLRNNCGRDNGP